MIKKLYNENTVLVANMIKGITGIAGTSLILTEGHPYWTLFVLCLGAAIHEYLMFVEKKKAK